MWKEQKHKALLFCQTRQMLDIIEQFVIDSGYKFCRLDGAIAVKQRMAIVEKFNNDPKVFLFILSTRVGGLGLNLIGANRVLIFDPDWNPSTDTQVEKKCFYKVYIFRLVRELGVLDRREK
jgi:DNA excision repair protein ERCC-6